LQGNNHQTPFILHHFDEIEKLLHRYIDHLFSQLDLDTIDEVKFDQHYENMSEITHQIGRITTSLFTLLKEAKQLHLYRSSIKRIHEQQKTIDELSARLIIHLRKITTPPNRSSLKLPPRIFFPENTSTVINVLK